MAVQSASPADFWADMQIADLGLLAAVRQAGSAHRCYREDPEFGRDEHRSFHLIINLSSPWRIAHRGRERMAPGDAMLTDSRFNHDIHVDQTYEFINLKLSEAWMRQWVPSPGSLVGRRIAASEGWGRALTAFAAQLTPRFLVQTPLPLSMVSDQLGALLALLASEFRASPQRPTRADGALQQRIQEVIVQRCAEPALTAAAVAGSLDLSTRTLHRVFTRFGETFGESLMNARVGLALRMLESPLYRRLTAAEIGRRAGFSDASHFTRVLRRRLGATPAQLRRRQGAGASEADEYTGLNASAGNLPQIEAEANSEH
ncbi:AraC-binding-like domain-containing protein [Variovorax sp. YR216]|nr:AraC-binding-like domain-containing protein [Variovorax sp. YR216]